MTPPSPWRSQSFVPATTETLEDDSWDKIIHAAVDARCVRSLRRRHLLRRTALESGGLRSDKKRVGYLAYYSKLGLIYCHVYSAKDKARRAG